MLRSTASIIFIAFVAIAVTSAIPPSAFTKDTPDESKAIPVYSETAVVAEEANSVETRAVTPYGYKAVMLPMSRNVDCWICSSPCSAYYCCNDGYPQCCLVNNRCMCCRV